jgi:type II secretory pathway predicted ATPase ExeA
LSEFAHLNEAARTALELPDAERIQRLRHPRWIGYPRAKEILAKLEELLEYPRIYRMPNLLLVGETNAGKTTIVRRFEQLHPPGDNAGGEVTITSVLIIQAPPVPEENRFYACILDALSAPYKLSESAGRRQGQVLHVLRSVGLRILIIDEIHHVLAGGSQSQRQFLNVLKYLGNELQIPVVGVGTIDALRAIQTDAQLANRFEPTSLPPWRLNEDFQRLLASFERGLPLREPSCLAAEPLATRLLALSEGTLGELAALLAKAATYAIITGRERIDAPSLAALDWAPPSERKHRAERMI